MTTSYHGTKGAPKPAGCGAEALLRAGRAATFGAPAAGRAFIVLGGCLQERDCPAEKPFLDLLTNNVIEVQIMSRANGGEMIAKRRRHFDAHVYEVLFIVRQCRLHRRERTRDCTARRFD